MGGSVSFHAYAIAHRTTASSSSRRTKHRLSRSFFAAAEMATSSGAMESKPSTADSATAARKTLMATWGDLATMIAITATIPLKGGTAIPNRREFSREAAALGSLTRQSARALSRNCRPNSAAGCSARWGEEMVSAGGVHFSKSQRQAAPPHSSITRKPNHQRAIKAAAIGRMEKRNRSRHMQGT